MFVHHICILQRRFYTERVCSKNKGMVYTRRRDRKINPTRESWRPLRSPPCLDRNGEELAKKVPCWLNTILRSHQQCIRGETPDSFNRDPSSHKQPTIYKSSCAVYNESRIPQYRSQSRVAGVNPMNASAHRSSAIIFRLLGFTVRQPSRPHLLLRQQKLLRVPSASHPLGPPVCHRRNKMEGTPYSLSSSLAALAAATWEYQQ